jgi:hypothetical protein
MPTFDDQAIEQALHTKTVKCHRKFRAYNFEASVKDLFWGLAEVAMYKADRFFDFHMVPPVIVKLEEEDEKQVLTCYSFWIEPQTIKITGSDHLKSLISETEWTQMNIFYFLFGQYDKHFGNQIIGQDGKLYLIDNEATANIRQFVFAYSPNKTISLPWVAQQINNTLQTTNEPDDFKEIISQQQDPQIIHEAFPDLDIYAKRDIDNGYTRIWKKILWRQMYAMSTEVSASFSETISQKLLQQLYELTEEKIFSFWPVLPFDTNETVEIDYQQRIKQFCKDTLGRRDMILAYFEQHPEGILKS